MKIAVAIVLACCSFPLPCAAWWESGHQLIAILAYDQLSSAEQQQLQLLLQQHPRLAEDFVPPNSVGTTPEDQARWRIGRAGYWPDVARAQPEYHRSTWHYQQAATLTIGDLSIPVPPGPPAADASLASQELHIAQAVEVCRRVLRDQGQPVSDRAVALCWVAHLVADAHQPCHAGSLYAAGVFPDGDRGANLIPTKQVKNLHALWDSLLGDGFDSGDIRRRSALIRADAANWSAAGRAASSSTGLDPLVWLAESARYGKSHVYAPEVLASVDAVARGLTARVSTVDLTDEYLHAAGELARLRAAFAARRLAAILHADLR